jgi:polysaccharide deacetylase family protein (PEP-CTERM system associated)
MLDNTPGITNALTIDLEDWIQSVFDGNLLLTDRFVANTYRILELLAAHDVRATFFVLGLAALKAPGLVREIRALGHEVQSHGYGHQLIHTQTHAEFRADVERSKGLLEDLVGERVVGYRAPRFSITKRTLWALDVLVDAGFEYDSSIFPLRLRGYGIKGTPLAPHVMRTPAGHEMLELPVAALDVGPLRVPVGGGGYFRLAPSWAIRRSVQRLNQQRRPAIVYCHPYEFAPNELRELHETRATPHGIPWRTQLHQGIGRGGFERKMSELLSAAQFGALREMLRNHPVAPPRLLAEKTLLANSVLKRPVPAEPARASRSESIAQPAGRR